MKERLRFPLYDTWRLAVGSISAGTKMDFFSTPKGATGSGFTTSKNELHTNLTTSGQMPYKVFRAIGLRLYGYSTGATPLLVGNLNQVLHNSVLSLKKEDRTILEVPLCWIPAGIGIFGNTTNATTDIVSNGFPVLSNIYRILPETYTTGDRLLLDITIKNSITIATNDTYVVVMVEGVVDKKF